MRRHVTILGLDQDVTALIDQNRPEGVVAVADGAAGNRE
ncbi:hypothetical protein V1278_002795 [Bradyrhizobium sp. AZCC 1577]